MRLQGHDVIPYLVRRGLLSRRAVVVEGGVRVVAAPRRNNNFKVEDPGGASFLVKQAVAPDRFITVAHEAEMYRLLAGRVALDVPDFYGFDPDAGVLVLGLLSDAVTVGAHHARTRRTSRAVARTLGAQLAALHALDADPSIPDARLAAPPWVLSVRCPDVNVLTNGSAASLQVMRLVQESPEFTKRMTALKDGWRTDAFVHRDLRWENCLLSRDAASGRWTRVTIVDWELAGRGDAAWDLGTLLASYLRLWLWSIPFVPDVPLGESMELARFPLDRVQPAVRALWGAYVSERGQAAGASSALAIRATRYAAAVLLQSAFEDAQVSMRVQPHLAHIVQLSYNILERPAEAAVYLLGLELAEGRP